MENIGSYFEIPVSDMERAIAFYSYVFNCDFMRDTVHGNEMAFFPLDDKGSGISGALAKGEIYKPSTRGSLVYLNTRNIDKSIDKVIEVNGEILFPKTEVHNYGWVAEFKDSEGNRVALFQKHL